MAKSSKSSVKSPVATAPVATAPVPQVTQHAPAQVAIRGVGVVTHVTLATRPYRVGSAHTAARWALLQAAAATHPQGHIALAPLLAQCLPGSAAHNYSGPGVPGHFVSYALRKGYLLAVPA